MSGPTHLGTGRWAESRAAEHLQSQGLRLLERNFRCRLGEIDLVMADGPVLVFVEVRFRRDSRFGDGAASITRAKQRRLLAAARAYLGRAGQASSPCRFDVVSVSKRNYSPDFLWVKDAFGQDA